MLPITRANLHNFCRVCLCDISKVEKFKTSSMCMCSNCDVKLEALRKFRCKAIVATGVLRIIVDEETLKSTPKTTPSSTLVKLKSICRLCLKEEKASHGIGEANQVNEIFECTGLNMLGAAEDNLETADVLSEDQYFPDKICSKCHTTIKSFIEFRMISVQTAEYLKNVFDGADNETDVRSRQSVREEEQMPLCETHEENGTQLSGDSIKSEGKFEIGRGSSSKEYTKEASRKKESFTFETIEIAAKLEFEENTTDESFDFDSEFFSVYKMQNQDLFINNKLNDQTQNDEEDDCSLEYHKTDFFKEPDNKNTKVKMKKQRAPKSFQKAFKCIECNKRFYKKFMYEAHIKSVHEHVEKPFSCLFCSNRFRLVQVLHRHMISCQKNPEFNKSQPCHTCLRCQKTFKRKEHLKEHIRAVHDKLKPFNCSVCNKAFGTKNTQIRHERNHSNDKPFSCEYCAKRYNSESELKVHLQRHLSKPELLCPICKRAKPTAEELQKHISMHNVSYQCTTCGKVFKKSFHLREHESTVHLKMRSLKCNFCDLTFSIRKTLKNHEKSHDAIGRPEKCALCDLNFKSKRALTLHSKKFHNKES